jgi:glycosyltransferase involved in cell wall biosynthesis
MKQKLMFVVPAFNEEKTIGDTLRDVKKHFPGKEVIVVNDGSTDKTKKIALKEGATVLTHIVNRGLGATLFTGIQAALNKNADIIVTFDADLQHTGRDVRKLIQPIKDKKADAVIGSRFLSKEDLDMMPSVKVLGNKFLTGITNMLSSTKVTDSQSGLRAFDRRAAEKLMILCDRYEVSSEIVHELGRHNLSIKEVPIKAIYHEVGKGTSISSGLHIFWGMLLKKLGVKR